MIAMLRTTYDQRRGDPLFQGMVSALDTAAVEFRQWWPSYRVATPSSGRKTLRQGEQERTPFVYAAFQANDNPALKLALYTRVR